ncbi:MAG: hypothetical protein KDJ52_09475 [Anaerolineae bacterium]|nr:hypothetical protein [Anaerolineae bacterium]
MDRLLRILKKIAYIGLILWLGVLAPITYFNVFATDHLVQPYSIAVFEKMPQKRSLPAEIISQQALIHLKQALSNQQPFVTTKSPFATFTQFLQSTISSASLVGSGALLLLAFYFGAIVPKNHRLEPSHVIAPPKKPPRFLHLNIAY